MVMLCVLAGCTSNSAQRPCPPGQTLVNDKCSLICVDDSDCEHASFCLGRDICIDGLCQNTPRDCDDNVGCTIDVCNAEAEICEHLPDDRRCTAEQTCDPVAGCVVPPACETSADCPDDGNPCTDALCSDGLCAHQNNTTPCADGVFCNGDEVCANGTCAALLLPSCDDGDAGTVDFCDVVADACAHATDVCDAAERKAWHPDFDGDGYGDGARPQTRCQAPTGYIEDATDCDDTDAGINPDTVWYLDADADSYGDGGNFVVQCAQPANHVLDAADCDDDVLACGAACYPGAAEVCDGYDNNCDGVPGLDEVDADGDMFLACEDCDDTLAGCGAACFPGNAQALCDGYDNDCDATTDEDYVAGGTVTLSGLDGVAGLVKGDTCGSGVCSGGAVICAGDQLSLACPSEAGAAAESCDGLDNSCDGITDEGCPCDYNGSSVGVCSDGVVNGTAGACDAPASYEPPPETTTDDGLDNDCDGVVDLPLTNGLIAYYRFDDVDLVVPVHTDDFSGYTAQADADAAWVPQNTSLARAIAGQYLQFTSTLSGNAAVSYDLGTAVSDIAWVLRFKLTMTAVNSSNNVTHVWNFGIFDQPSSVAGETGNYATFQGQIQQAGPCCTRYLGAATGGGVSPFAHTPVAETLWVEVVRSSATLSIELFSDAYVTSIEKQSGSTTATGLRYVAWKNTTPYSGPSSSGSIDNIQLWDGVASANIVRNVATTANLSITPDWSDDFSSYGSNGVGGGWRSNDLAATYIDAVADALAFTLGADGSNDSMVLDLQDASVLGAGALAAERWLARFRLNFQNVVDGEGAIFWLGMRDADETVGRSGVQSFIGVTVQNRVGFQGLQYNAQDRYQTAFLGGSGDTAVSVPWATGLNYFFEIARDSATRYVVRRYTNSTYSTILDEAPGTSDAATPGLRYLGLVSFDDISASGQLAGTLDNFVLYNNPSHLGPTADAELIRATTGMPGILGQAFELGATGQHVSVPDAGFPAGNEVFSASAWVKMKSLAGWQHIYSIGSANTGQAFYVANSAGFNDGTLEVGTWGVNYLTSTGKLSVGNWHHVAVTHDGTQTRLYLNGNLDAVASQTLGVVLDGDLQLGANPTSVDSLDGVLDELALWRRALTDAEITAIYNAGTGLDLLGN